MWLGCDILLAHNALRTLNKLKQRRSLAKIFQPCIMPVTNFSIAVLMGNVEDTEIVHDDVQRPSQNTNDYALPDQGILQFCFNTIFVVQS